MLDIITSCTIEDCNELQGELSTLRYITGDVDAVRTALYALTEMDGVIANLGAKVADLQNECEILKQMAQALDKANLCYTGSENRICSYAEQGVVKFEAKDLKTVNLTGISGVLGNNDRIR